MKTTTLVATLTSPPTSDARQLAAITEQVGVLEVRADLVGELDVDRLREAFAGQLLYTLRSRDEGGAFDGDPEAREARLAAAARTYDLVDLEAERDLEPEILDAVPAERRLLSWHGTVAHLGELTARFERLDAVPARYYKLIPHAATTSQGLVPLELLRQLGRDDVVAFATGEAATWTRILAPHLGSPLVYGALGESPGAPGQLTVERLRTDYGLPALPQVEFLCGILGHPVAHSLSPRLHNGAYRELEIPGLYLPFDVEAFADFWLEVVESGRLDQLGFPLRGFSVTAPHKHVALAVSGVSSPRSQHVGAANTLVRDAEGVWEAESTDPEGVARLLELQGVAMAGRPAAVVGCGGAGKASAYGLQIAGAEVTLVNRGRARGERAAQEMDLPFLPLADFDPAKFDILVQATALGHHADDELPFSAERVRADATVIDLVYGAGPTSLLRKLRARGVRAFGGRRVLLHQAFSQFRLMTGRELDEPLARRLLELEDEP